MNSAVHLGFALSLVLGGTAVAQEATPLSAPDSTPDALGLMQGFPPAPDKTIRFTDPDYFAFPKLRWTVCHLRELMPTTAVRNGSEGASELTLHSAMSVTKSLTGLLGEVLVAEGKLDETALVGDIIPEPARSAFGDATVRQVLDMTTAVDYSEDYSDPDAEVWTYARAGSPYLVKDRGRT